MLPANVLQGPPTIGYIDGLVSDITEIASPIATKNFKEIVLVRGAYQASHGCIGGRFVPVVHSFSKCLPGFPCLWYGRFIHRSHRPIPLAHIAGLRLLEMVECPK